MLRQAAQQRTAKAPAPELRPYIEVLDEDASFGAKTAIGAEPECNPRRLAGNACEVTPRNRCIAEEIARYVGLRHCKSCRQPFKFRQFAQQRHNAAFIAGLR